MDVDTRKLLEQLLINIDACLHGEGRTGATLRLMQIRIRTALETPEERVARMGRVDEAKQRVKR